MSIRNLDALLEPKSVAVIGASDRAGSVGATVWRNLRNGAFRGTITPVNPHHRQLDGVDVLRRCSDLPAPHDLAIVCTGPRTLAPVIAELAAAGTRAAIVLTTGVDAALAQALRAQARPTTMRLLGPGCLGLLSPHIGLNASAAHIDALAGNVAFVSQSATLASAVLDWSKSRQLGFSHVVSIGDQMDVDFGDLLDHLASDASTRAILLYIESVAAPRKFMSAARAAARNKPVIVLKPRSGPSAGSDAVFDAAVLRAGMLRVDTLQDLFTAVQTLARFDADVDRGLTIMANGRGAASMAADGAAHFGVAPSTLPASLATRLAAIGCANGGHDGSIDVGHDASVERHVATLEAVLAEPSTGAILFMHAPTAAVRSADIARACLPLVKKASRRLLACWLGDDSVTEARHLFEEAGVADFETPEEAVHAFSMLATYRRNQALLLEAPSANPHGAPDKARARTVVAGALAAGREWLDEIDSLALLEAYGVPTLKTMRSTATVDDAVRTAEGAGGPRRPFAPALVAGATIDPVFGPVLMLGEGPDASVGAAFALPPLNRVLARDLVARLRAAGPVAGRRQRAPADADALCDVLVALSRMQADLPELAALHIDPLQVDEQGVLALGARAKLSATPVAGAQRFAILPFPDELTERVDWQGRTIVIRPVRPEDEALHRAFIAHVAPSDLRLRFFSSRRELPRTELARLVQIDYAREMAFIALDTASDGTAETLGVVRAVCDPDNVEAEFAILVRSDVQGRRLGFVLLSKLVRYLRERGTRRMVGYVLSENQAMRRLVETLGFQIESLRKEPGAVYYTLDLQGATAQAARVSPPTHVASP